MPARIRALYFLYHFGFATLLCYFALYLRELGFHDSEVSFSQVVGVLLGGPAGIAWSVWGGHRAGPDKALRGAAAVSLLLTFLPLARTPLSVAAALVLYGFSFGAMLPLIEAVVLAYIRQQGRGSFSRYRMFAAIGFASGALVIGGLLARLGPGAAQWVVPLAFTASVVGTAAVALTLPALPGAGTGSRFVGPWKLLGDRRIGVALVAFALHQASCVPYYRLFGMFVADRALPPTVTGIATSVGVVAEVVAYALLPRLRVYLSRSVLLAGAFALTAFRWFALSRAGTVWEVVALQLLQGATFAVFWGNAVQLFVRLVPSRMRSGGQALLSAVVFAGGDALGLSLAGLAAHRFSVSELFAVAAVLELVPLLLMVPLFRWTDSATARAQPLRDLFGQETTHTGSV
ncbi:MAG TPA: MFS transporter [Myxococcaceae bacterium]|nr:MFS transporter [Myxococcaceae bacterium]